MIVILLITILAVITMTNPIQANWPEIETNLGPEDEVFDDLYLQGSEVLVGGRVHGMLFVVGENIVIQSTAVIANDIFIVGKHIQVEDGARIIGNLYVVGQNVIINSMVGNNLVVGSATLDLTSPTNVEKNLFFGGFHLSLSTGSQVKENLYAGCYQASISGDVDQNLRISAVSVDLNGEIKGNAEIAIDASGDDEGIRIWLPYMQQLNIPDLIPTGLMVGNDAEINGQLFYTSAKSLEGNLKNLPIGGVVENIQESSDTQIDGKNKIVQKNPFVLRFLRMLRHSVGLLFFAAIAWPFGKKYLAETTLYAIKNPLKAFGVGFVSTLVVNLGSFVFLVIIIFFAILLGIFTLNHLSTYLLLMGLSVIIIVLVLFGILTMYISKLILAYWVGGLFLNKINFHRENMEAWSLFIGIIIYLILNAIPVLGWILGVVVSLIGIGAIWYTMQNHDRAGLLPDFE